MRASATGNLSRISCVVLAAVLSAACGGPAGSPEEAIRAWVGRGEAAAENRDRPALVDMISPAYADGRGNRREDIDHLLRGYFLRQRHVSLLTRIDRIEVVGGSAAELDLRVAMAAGNDSPAGFSADAVRLEMELELDGEDWRLVAARWGGIGDDVL